MDRAKEAYEMMSNRKMNCAQAVFRSFCKEYGISENTALSLAQGFGGGMAHTGRTCGAVSGAYMALGLSRKTMAEKPRENIDKTYALMADFDRKFKSLHGSVNCTELLGYNLGIKEEADKAAAEKVFITRCPIYVRDAVKIVEELLGLK